MTINSAGDIVSAQDYYAYGELLRAYTTADDHNKRFLFTEKERDTESGYDYFGARYYDSDIARWTTIDPLWELRHGLSPYNYCQNNPLGRIDPDGRLDWLKQKIWGSEAAGIYNNDGGGEKKKKEENKEKKQQDISVQDFINVLGIGIEHTNKLFEDALNITNELIAQGEKLEIVKNKIQQAKSLIKHLGTAGLLLSTSLDAIAYGNHNISEPQMGTNIFIGLTAAVSAPLSLSFFIFDKVFSTNEYGGIENMCRHHDAHIKRNIQNNIPIPSFGMGW